MGSGDARPRDCFRIYLTVSLDQRDSDAICRVRREDVILRTGRDTVDTVGVRVGCLRVVSVSTLYFAGELMNYCMIVWKIRVYSFVAC